jgi:hypothetical protein
MDRFCLTSGDRASALWEKLQERNRERIERALQDLAKPLPIEETNLIRGRLIELREFEKLERIEPIVP